MTQANLFTSVVKVQSSSNPGTYYEVDLSAKTCTCPQFTKAKKICKHLKELGVPAGPADKSSAIVSKLLREEMQAYHKLSLTRLSKNFILRDFLFSTEAAMLGISNRPEDIEQVIKAGKDLCEKVLEPILEKFGRFSITFGYMSRELFEAHQPNAAYNSSSPHQWDRGTFGKQIYARVDILPFCVMDGEVSKKEFAKWCMMNLDLDLLMMWRKSDVFCITIGPKPRRVWLEWVPQGQGQGGSNRIEYMGAEYWGNFNEHTEPKPKHHPSHTNGKMSWS